MKRIFILILTILVEGFTISFAQGTANYQVKGQIKDARTGETMPLVNVALLRPSDSVFMRGATSDMTGNYAIWDVAAGQYLLRATSVGFETCWMPVEVTGNTTLSELSLRPVAATLEAVRVTAKRPIFAMDGEKNLYNVAEDPSVQGGTAADALRSAPGVEVDMAGNITLRGVSSVDIWINGKPSHLDGESLKQYIKTLPADAIDRIEVITNPSARYSSNGGVINIVTNAKIQRNDFFTLALFGNTDPTFVPHASYVHGGKKGSINLYAGPKFTNTHSHTEYSSFMKDDSGNIVDEYTYVSDDNDHGNGYFVGANFDYTFNSKNTIQGWGGIFGGHGLNDKTGSMLRILNQTDSNGYTQTSHTQYKTPGYWGGLTYEHLFNEEGHKLNVSLNGTGYIVKPWKSDEYYSVLDRGFESFTYAINDVNRTNEIGVEANYVLPVTKNGTLEAGLGYSNMFYSEDKTTDTINRSTLMQAPHDLYTICYSHAREKGEAYATYQHRLGRLTAKAGLRAELSNCRAQLEGNALAYQNKLYFDVMPSIHLTYSTEKMDNFKFNYTRRFAHPEASQIAPYRNYNLESFTIGNPALLTSYTHNLEAGYTKFIPQFGYLSIEAYYHGNTNEIGSLSDVVFDANFNRIINYSIPMNIGNSSTLGAQLNATYRPNAYVTLNLEGQVFNNRYKAQYRPGLYTEDEMLSWSASLRGFVKVWKKVDVFCNLSHTSPTIGLLTRNGSNNNMTLGFSADLLDHHLTLFAGVNDPFNWNRIVVDNSNPYFTYSNNVKMKSRNIMFGCNLRFGKMELESKSRVNQK